MRYVRSGFTLVELMVAAAASLILTSIAFASLLTFQQMSQKQDEKATQKAELQRALNFIARGWCACITWLSRTFSGCTT
jgi:prepilin-type N-terminal cleavage/methylation domain-containing protein